jgi:hypothetical protein
MVEPNIKEALNIARRRYINDKYDQHKQLFKDCSEEEYQIMYRAAEQIFSMSNVLFDVKPVVVG